MADVDDWAAKAARKIIMTEGNLDKEYAEVRASEARIAAIIRQHCPIKEPETITVLRCNVCGRLTMPKDGKTTCSCGGTFEQVEWTLTYD